MKRLLLASASLAALSALVPAQQHTARPIHGPLRYVSLGADGEITPSQAWNPAIDVAGTTFANVTTAGLYAAPLVAEEWIDWGVKSGLSTGVACTIEIAYGTTAIDPSLGGPGADLEVAVYAGTLGGCAAGDVSAEAQRFTLSGLPGTLDGNPAGVVVSIPLSNQTFLLGDGPIGWGYVGVDGVTGPLLITVGADTTGTVDGFDIYVPAPASSGFCLGTFPFVTPGVGSFYLRLEEDDGSQPGLQSVRLGTGANIGVLSLAATPPTIGQVWAPDITTPAVATPILDFIALSSVSTPPAFVPGIGEILIGIGGANPLAVISGPAGAGSPFTIPLPLNCAFIGVSLTSQAGQVDISGTLGLTDAIDFTFGN